MDGTRGSGVLSSTGDVLEMSVVRGVSGVCVMCMCLARRGVGGGGVSGLEDCVWALPILWEQGDCWTCVCVWLRWCRWGVGRGLEPGSGGVGWCYVCVSLGSLCRWQVHVSLYCAWRIPAHLRCTQCSILFHLMDICFLTCICLWQILQIQTRVFNVVVPGLVSTSPAFVRSSASHPAGPHGRLAKKR